MGAQDNSHMATEPLRVQDTGFGASACAGAQAQRDSTGPSIPEGTNVLETPRGHGGIQTNTSQASADTAKRPVFVLNSQVNGTLITKFSNAGIGIRTFDDFWGASVTPVPFMRLKAMMRESKV